jgi:hypothetical protein
MHATFLTFFLGEMQNSRRFVFCEDLEILGTDSHGILGIRGRGDQTQRHGGNR